MTDKERNVLIAEKVMGWTVHESPTHGVLCDGAIVIGDGHKVSNIMVNGRKVSNFELPNFVGNIADAWMLLDKLRADGWDVSIYLHASERCSVSITCAYGPCVRHGTTTDNWHGVEGVRAASPPRAIYEATLKALGIEETNGRKG